MVDKLDVDLASRFRHGHWSACWIEWQAIAGGAFPDLSPEQQVVAFRKWDEYYGGSGAGLGPEKSNIRERAARVAELWRERDTLRERQKLLSRGSLEWADIERQIWDLATKVSALMG